MAPLLRPILLIPKLSAGLAVFVGVMMVTAGIADQREQTALKAQQAAAVMCVADPGQSIDYHVSLRNLITVEQPRKEPSKVPSLLGAFHIS